MILTVVISTKAIVGAMGLLVGCSLQLYIIQRYGRLIQLRLALLFCGVATVVIGQVQTKVGIHTSTFFGVLFQQFAVGILYL